MRKLFYWIPTLIVFSMQVLISCKEKPKDPIPDEIAKSIFERDSLLEVYKRENFILDSVRKKQVALISDLEELAKPVRNNKLYVDSLKTALFRANYRISRVKYHLNICLKNKSQDVFLKGWIARDLTE